MNKRYLFEGKTTKAVVEYDSEGGIACKIQFSDADAKAVEWFLKNLPIEVSEIPEFSERVKGFVKMIEMPPDLSFARFWDNYDYKVGRKEKVIQLWQALSEAERLKALTAIPKYKQWLALKPNMEKLYPQSFLNQRRWENDFRV